MEDLGLFTSLMIIFILVCVWMISTVVLLMNGSIWGVVLMALAAMGFLFLLLLED